MKNFEITNEFSINTNPEEAARYYNFILPKIPICPSDFFFNPNYEDKFLQEYFQSFANLIKRALVNSETFYDIEVAIKKLGFKTFDEWFDTWTFSYGGEFENEEI